MMAAKYNSEDDLSELLQDEFLCCQICLSEFNNPKSLPCLHNFCLSCIEQYVSKNQGNLNSTIFICPTCRAETSIPKSGLNALPSNFHILTLMNAVRKKRGAKKETLNCDICQVSEKKQTATHKCTECGNHLCEPCAQGHAKYTTGHNVLHLDDHLGCHDDKLSLLTCPKHKGQDVESYCTLCKMIICKECYFTYHTGHTTEKLSTYTNKDTFFTKMGEFTKIIEKLKLEIENIKIDIQDSEKEKADLEMIIDSSTSIQGKASSLIEINNKGIDTIQQLVDLTQQMKEMGTTATSKLIQPVLQPIVEVQSLEIRTEWIKPRLKTEFDARLTRDTNTCWPAGIACGSRIIIADFNNDKVKTFNQQKRLLNSWSYFRKQQTENVLYLDNPSDAILYQDQLVVVNSGYDTILFIRNDRITRTVKLKGCRTVTECAGSLFASTCHRNSEGGQQESLIYEVVDDVHPQLMQITENGKEFIFGKVEKITSTLDGNLVIADIGFHSVFVVRPGTCEVLHKYGSYGHGVNNLDYPYGVCVDKRGHIIVADKDHDCLHLLTPQAKFVSHLLTKEDGLEYPVSVTFDYEGNLVVGNAVGEIKTFSYNV